MDKKPITSLAMLERLIQAKVINFYHFQGYQISVVQIMHTTLYQLYEMINNGVLFYDPDDYPR